MQLTKFGFMSTTAPHIVQYQGSKRVLAPQILMYMPQKFDRLVEPFCGMAAVSIAVAQKRYANRFLINDINTPLVNILKKSIEAPDELLADYKALWKGQFSFEGGSLAHYNYVRDCFNEGSQTPENMLYLLARCAKGSVRYGRNGNFNQSPDKRRFGTNPDTLSRNVHAVSSLLYGKTEFYSLDYREILKMTKKGDVVYMDPPYQGVSNVRDCRYVAGVSFDEFSQSVEELNSKGVDFIISYDGKCGEKEYGEDLPMELGCKKVMLKAGFSSQSILLGKKEITYEALYISKGLQSYERKQVEQLSIFDELSYGTAATKRIG